MARALGIAVAAKGVCQPQLFIEALIAGGIAQAAHVSVHIAHDEAWPAGGPELPGNVVLHQCPQGTSVLKLWGVAIVRSAGDYVAVLDIHCPPEPGWLRGVTLETDAGSPLFFGPVDPGWGPGEREIVGYITEYAQFRSPLVAELDEVPGNNIVCLRELFDDSARLETQGFFKTFMVWRLASERGVAPARRNDMIVRYRKPFNYRHYMARRFVHGRCFGATRHDNAGQPPRLVCLVFTLFLPILRCLRIYRAVRKHGELRVAFYRFLYLVLQSEIAWSAGEFVGYAAGGRRYCEQLD